MKRALLPLEVELGCWLFLALSQLFPSLMTLKFYLTR